MTQNNTDEHTRAFFLYSLRTGRTDITMNIPAKDALEAEELLEELVVHPENWQREEAIENRIKDRKTTGKRKGPKEWVPPVRDSTGPMFG